MWILVFLFSKVLLFFFQFHTCDIAYGNCCSDNSQYAEWIGAGISRGYLWHVSLGEDTGQGFIGGTKSRGVGYGTIECADHHREIVNIMSIKENPIADKHYSDVEQYHCGGKQVECDTSFSETFEKAWAYLKTNAEHEKNQAEILDETKNVCGGCKADMSCNNACKEHKGHAERDTSYFHFA